MSRPNIIYLHSHDTGRYISPYGYRLPTPNLQRLAEQGVVFRNAFNAAPTCSPSRAALLTGASPHSSGQLGLTNRGFNLRDTHKHLCHTLKGAGYRTALFGVTHLHVNHDLLGYDERYTDRTRGGNGITDEAVAYLRQDHDQPFFAAIGYGETHRVFPEPAADINPAFLQPPAPLPDLPAVREDMAAYATMVRTLDGYYGRILDALDEQGLADNTLVIATTDHGLAFPLMKCRLTDHGMGVLLIVRGPGFAGGRAIDGLVSQIDLYPTLCEIAGIEPPDWLEGTSLMPLVDGSAQEVNDEIFSEVTYHAAYEPKRAVRTQRYKYVRRYDPQDTAPMANIDASISKDVMVNHGLQDRPPGREQLYDLIWDPHEACNLAGDPGSAAILEDLRGRLDGWMEATSDPLLDGSVPQPPNTWINPHADLHPHERRRD